MLDTYEENLRGSDNLSNCTIVNNINLNFYFSAVGVNY